MPRASYLTYLLVSALMVATWVPSQAITCNYFDLEAAASQISESTSLTETLIPKTTPDNECAGGQCTRCYSAIVSITCTNVTFENNKSYDLSTTGLIGTGVSSACPSAATVKKDLDKFQKALGYSDLSCVTTVKSDVTCCNTPNCNRLGEFFLSQFSSYTACIQHVSSSPKYCTHALLNAQGLWKSLAHL